MLPTIDADAADVTKCSTTMPSSSTAIWVYRAPGSVARCEPCRAPPSPFDGSRRARNSASVRTGGRRRPRRARLGAVVACFQSGRALDAPDFGVARAEDLSRHRTCLGRALVHHGVRRIVRSRRFPVVVTATDLRGGACGGGDCPPPRNRSRRRRHHRNIGRHRRRNPGRRRRIRGIAASP